MIKILLSVQDDWLLWEVGSNIGLPSLLHPSLRFLMLKCFMKHFPALNFLSVKFWHLTGFVSRRLPPSPLDLPSLRSLWLLASVSPQESSLVFFTLCLSQESLCGYCPLGTKKLHQFDGATKMSASSPSVKEGGGLPTGRR